MRKTVTTSLSVPGDREKERNRQGGGGDASREPDVRCQSARGWGTLILLPRGGTQKNGVSLNGLPEGTSVRVSALL